MKYKWIVVTEPKHPNYVVHDFMQVEKYAKAKAAVEADEIEKSQYAPNVKKYARLERAAESLTSSPKDHDDSIVSKSKEDGCFWENDPDKVHKILDALEKDKYVTGSLHPSSDPLPSKEELKKKSAVVEKEPEQEAPAKKASK